MNKIIILLEELINLEFRTNKFADKNHENLIRNKIIDFGLTEVTDHNIKIILKDQNNKNKRIEQLAGISVFIEQPFGSQMSPDFILCIDGFILWVECKSGKEKVTWNSGYPKEDILYVFSCKKKNTTTIFLGQLTEIHLNNPDFEVKYNKFDRKIKQIAEEIFGNWFITNFFSFYMRRMLNDLTKYSKKETREIFNQKTLDYYSNLEW